MPLTENLNTLKVLEYTFEDLKDVEKQKEVFQHMLRLLERDGKCRGVFHKLAYVVYDCDME